MAKAVTMRSFGHLKIQILLNFAVGAEGVNASKAPIGRMQFLASRVVVLGKLTLRA